MSRRVKTPAIGIDLGTTYSSVAAWLDQHERVEIFPNEQGYKIIPSCVAFNEFDQLLVGNVAKQLSTRNPTNTVFDVKRLIGGRFSDRQMQEEIKSWPFKVVQGSNDKPMVVVKHGGIIKEFSAEEISSLILKNLKAAAEAFFEAPVTDVVITVPGFFSNKQRQATKDAGTLAGLNVLRLISAPTAAAIAYALKIHGPKEKNVIVFYLGGGTFDVSLVSICKECTIKVKAVRGDTHLGGKDFDKAMVDYCVQEFKKKQRKDISKNARAMARLKVACEQAKRELTSATVTSIDMDSLYEGTDFSMKITRAKFEELNVGFFNKCIEHVKNCLSDGKMDKNDVDDIILVGGSTRIPKVQQMLTKFFDDEMLCISISADKGVVYGAAVLAANLSGHGNKYVQTLVLSDVTPLSLGVNLIGGRMGVLIPRNTPIPTFKEVIYDTTKDNQVTVRIGVYQGESNKYEDNIFLDEFYFQGIPPAPAGKEKVKVCFNINADGILHISTELLSNGNNTRSITIARSEQLSLDTIEKMMRKSEL